MVRGNAKLVPYDSKIIATKCRTCEVEPPNRCRPKGGGSPAKFNYPPHATRVADSRKEPAE